MPPDLSRGQDYVVSFREDEDARMTGQEPDWQVPPRHASEGTSSEHPQLRSGISQDRPVSQSIAMDNILNIDTRQLSLEPSAVETQSIRRPFPQSAADVNNVLHHPRPLNPTIHLPGSRMVFTAHRSMESSDPRKIGHIVFR